MVHKYFVIRFVYAYGFRNGDDCKVYYSEKGLKNAWKIQGSMGQKEKNGDLLLYVWKIEKRFHSLMAEYTNYLSI